MHPITEQLSAAFRAAISKAFSLEVEPVIAPSQSLAFGDYQCNSAMGLAKRIADQAGTKANPRDTAAKIIEALNLGDMAEEISVAGPGFINVRLSPAWVSVQLNKMVQSERLGVDPADHPVRTVVDYSGPNIAKQMHVGHLRSSIIGDAIARVLEFEGHEVIRQNHIGDWGTQFGMLIAHLRESGAADHSSEDTHITDLEEFYQKAKKRFDEDEAFQMEARATVVRLQGGDPVENALWKKIVEETRRHYQPIYERLGVSLKPEHERGESFYNPYLESVVKDLKSSGLAVESEGATAVFAENFQSPLLVQKSDGGYLYATTDLAAIRYRINELKAGRLVYVHDSRQAQHFAQVFDTARRAGWAADVSLEFAPFGTMLGADNKPFKTREGGTVKLKDLLNEAANRAVALITERERKQEIPEEKKAEIGTAVGIGAVKYSDLSKDRTADYVFAWDKMLSFEGNTAPYLQYAYTRTCSLFRKLEEESIKSSNADALILEEPQELALGKHLLKLGEVLEITGRELKPHHLCTYLYGLATLFSSFWENCPVLLSEGAVQASRIQLCRLTNRTMALGLDLLGISHPEQM